MYHTNDPNSLCFSATSQVRSLSSEFLSTLLFSKTPQPIILLIFNGFSKPKFQTLPQSFRKQGQDYHSNVTSLVTISLSFSVAVTDADKKHLGEKRVYLAYTSTPQSIIEKSQDRNLASGSLNPIHILHPFQSCVKTNKSVKHRRRNLVFISGKQQYFSLHLTICKGRESVVETMNYMFM